VLAAAAAALVRLPPALVERYYARGAYPAVQNTLTPLTNLVPVALLDIAAAALLVALAVTIRRRIRTRGVARGLASAGLTAVVTGAALYLIFLAFWGLNYRRVPLERKLAFDAGRITRDAGRHMTRVAIEEVNSGYDDARRPADRAALADAFARTQQALGAGWLAVPGAPKASLLAFYFRWAAIDGMTDPWFLEVVVNPDVLPVERPFVLAHEWAHLAGYADESEANFVAWLTCLQGDPTARYSGWHAIYAHLLAALPRADRADLVRALAPGPRQDLAAISRRLQRSAPVVRTAAREVYDSYLRANRVERGIESYDAVIRLVLGTTFRPGWTPELAGN
jgi:hypothetical protein